jgi:hypothetical protein
MDGHQSESGKLRQGWASRAHRPSRRVSVSVVVPVYCGSDYLAALVAALETGHPGYAAVDVFESEPILQGHPLLRLENAVCTPHIGYVEQDSYELLFSAAFDNVVDFIAGNPKNIVNPEALRVPR